MANSNSGFSNMEEVNVKREPEETSQEPECHVERIFVTSGVIGYKDPLEIYAKKFPKEDVKNEIFESLKGKVINSQGRQIVHNVIKFMQDEAEQGITVPFTKYRKRILTATGVSKGTYESISKEGKNIAKGATTSFGIRQRKKPRKSRVLDEISVNEIQDIRRIIYDFVITEKKGPTLNLILQKVKVAHPTFSGSKTTLWKLCRKIGFRWRNTEDSGKVLFESYDNRYKRIDFLKKIQQYRKENRNIIYADETCIDRTHSQFVRCYDETTKKYKKPGSKGRRLVIVHAGGENGFVTNGLGIFPSGAKLGDYRPDMSEEFFFKWVQELLLPNLPKNSVLVIDNASYHNILIKPSKNTAARKDDMIKWLKEKNIPCDENMLKTELYCLVKQRKEIGEKIKYKLDELMESNGHIVLRLPPYHSDLNPIEKIWTDVKNYVLTHNSTFKLEDVERIVKEKFRNISTEELKRICEDIKEYENELLEKEDLMDLATDSIQFMVDPGSSEDSFSSEEEISRCDRLSSDSD